MKWFLSNRVPPVERILLVESGPAAIAESVIPRLRQSFGEQLPIDRLTWTATKSSTSPRVWRTADYPSTGGRLQLLREIRRSRPPIVAVICANTAYLRSWRAAVLAAVPAKILIVNENADFFWLDRANFANLRQMLLRRSGLVGESTVHLAGRALLFPIAFSYLAMYAFALHSRRSLRTLFR